MDVARYAVDAVVLEGRSLRWVAALVGMSKSWVEKQVKAYRHGGYPALGKQSTAPIRRPTQAPATVENQILALGKQLTEQGLDGGPATI